METKEAKQQSRCSPLTSDDLFDGAVDKNAERLNEIIREMRVLVETGKNEINGANTDEWKILYREYLSLL